MNIARINPLFTGTADRTLTALAIGVSLLAGCASLPSDGKDAKMTRYDSLRAMRYCGVRTVCPG